MDLKRYFESLCRRKILCDSQRVKFQVFFTVNSIHRENSKFIKIETVRIQAWEESKFRKVFFMHFRLFHARNELTRIYKMASRVQSKKI